MAKGFKHGPGGTSLNFDVKAFPSEEELLAAVPKKNIVGIVTTVPIKSWKFCAEKPQDSGFRYIKLQMDALSGTGSTVKINDIRFEADSGEVFVYPASARATSSIEAVSASETAQNLIDNVLDMGFCSTKWVSGSYVLIDMGASQYIDLAKYRKWSWYTAEDAVNYKGRGLKTFSLLGSNDGSSFTLLDSVTDYNVPDQNSVAAYTGTLYDTPYEEPDDGQVLIATGTSSSVEFNALKKNAIQVYPLSAYQYVEGAWKEVTAMSYLNGEWVNWWTYLYRSGNTYDSITGGWGITTSEGRVTFNTDSVSLVAAGSNLARASIYTKNKIDLTPYKTLYVHYTDTKGRSGSYGCQIIQVWDTLNASAGWPFNGLSVFQEDANVTQQDFLLWLDVSQMNGSFYIGTTIDTKATDSYGVIDEIWIV